MYHIYIINVFVDFNALKSLNDFEWDCKLGIMSEQCDISESMN